jgi:hypothetical protein
MSSDEMRATVALLMPGRTAQNSAQKIPKMAKISKWWPTASSRSSMLGILHVVELYEVYHTSTISDNFTCQTMIRVPPDINRAVSHS